MNHDDQHHPIDLVLSWWRDLRWRHHGTGMLQAYCPDRTKRVHIWHAGLVMPNALVGGSMHNHRFAFTSTVLHGTIEHSYLSVEPDEHGAHQLFDIRGASDAAKDDFIPAERVTVKIQPTRVFGLGTKYHVEKWQYHWARPAPRGIGVTLVEITDKEHDRTARVVCPYGVTPAPAITTMQRDDMLPILTSARRALEYLR